MNIPDQPESERVLWLLVIQTFLVDANKIRKMRCPTPQHEKRRYKKWMNLYQEAASARMNELCLLVDIEHEVFLRRLNQVLHEGYEPPQLYEGN